MMSRAEQIFQQLDLAEMLTAEKGLVCVNPTTEGVLAYVKPTTVSEYDSIVQNAQKAFEAWRLVPAPQRGDVLRKLAVALRKHKDILGELISLEVGKIRAEGLGEVQEAIDICDFAVGLSRQLYGKTMHSERPSHRMYEQWHPLGVVGVITAFNFPCAVWAWNAAIAAVCGNTLVWKPSEKAPLTALALQGITSKVFKDAGYEGVMNLVVGTDKSLGVAMSEDKRLPLISATGSVPMGREVGQAVAKRLGRSILELGGNNAIIVTKDADIELAIRGIAFGAVGTAGQRCTTTRRLYVDKAIYAEVTEKLKEVYQSISYGNPLEEDVLLGPLIDKQAVDSFAKAIEEAKKQGAKVLAGGKAIEGAGYFVEPTLLAVDKPLDIMQEETFAPILYVCPFEGVEQAIDYQNSVPQGLSSAMFTSSLHAAEDFLSHKGSDCGIANINIGTSGAEIGGAFGGEKETGGGRESGSDAWKAYMRRQTCTINYGHDLPLAQGVTFSTK